MKIKIFFMIFVSINVFSQAPERFDKYFEFSFSSFHCSYLEDYPLGIIENIIESAKNGNSQAAYFLFYGSNIINNKNIPDFDALLQLMIDAGNPHGIEIKAVMLFKEGKYEDGLFLFERAAEMGMISINTHMHEIYNGKKYPKLKNIALELYWWKRSALSGNIYSLKQYIYNNPEKLANKELKHWQNAYEIMIHEENLEISKKEISTKTKWILYQINENRERIANVLKKHHPWYGNYKHCK